MNDEELELTPAEVDQVEAALAEGPKVVPELADLIKIVNATLTLMDQFSDNSDYDAGYRSAMTDVRMWVEGSV